MTHKVGNYVTGRWQDGEGSGTVVRDASTGVPVAEVNSSGIDFGAVVDYAHNVGGPPLRAMTFQQRALALKNLAKYLSEHTESVFENWATTGGIHRDAQIEIEGGIDVLNSYARLVQRELPNDTVYMAGTPETLIRPDFMGQTMYTTREGVAVHINAYNFPVWAMLEKLAPTFIAGLPCIIKPATATAHMAEAMFRHIVDSGALPEGSVQFFAGRTRDLFDHLTGQDTVAFTGSAETAQLLRTHPCFVLRGARFNAEADSLNANVLGPDVTPDDEEFVIFYRQVVHELTSKAGQKCTAIRRIFVPTGRVDDAIEAIRGRLEGIVVGDPRRSETRMGPLAGVEYRDSLAQIVDTLRQHADIVVGGPKEYPYLDGEEFADGAFYPPTILLARDIEEPDLHTLEPFGPVATIFPYDDPDDLPRLVAMGAGSLVASVVTHDPEFARKTARGFGRLHGRVLIVEREQAKVGLPHGAVFPRLIHGGPGRAGGGEELGGLRGVLHLMQATSLSGSAQMLAQVTNTWNSAAPTRAIDRHPFRLYLEELEPGDTLFTDSRTITLEDIEHFAEFTGDTFYAHMDEEAAKASPLFKGRVAHGYFIIAAAAGLFVDPDPGPVLANFGLDQLRFLQPVYPGDTIKLRLTCKRKTLRPQGGWGEVAWDVEVTNQRDEPVATYDLLTINASRDSA